MPADNVTIDITETTAVSSDASAGTSGFRLPSATSTPASVRKQSPPPRPPADDDCPVCGGHGHTARQCVQRGALPNASYKAPTRKTAIAIIFFARPRHDLNLFLHP